jgi:hypothetical protein
MLAYVLPLTALTTSSASYFHRYTYDEWLSTCGGDPRRAWLVDHVKWQRDNKYNSTTKYLGYSCLQRGVLQEGHYLCHGLGDRTRCDGRW